jgi:hypothetical protein
MKYHCTVTSETEYVIEADSPEEAYEAAWTEASDTHTESAIVAVEIKDL